jgi:hypothetical protein
LIFLQRSSPRTKNISSKTATLAADAAVAEGDIMAMAVAVTMADGVGTTTIVEATTITATITEVVAVAIMVAMVDMLHHLGFLHRHFLQAKVSLAAPLHRFRVGMDAVRLRHLQAGIHKHNSSTMANRGQVG